MKKILFIFCAFLLSITIVNANNDTSMVCFGDATLCVESDDVHSASQDDFGTLISRGDSYIKFIDTTFNDMAINQSMTLELSGDSVVNYVYIKGEDLILNITGDGTLKVKEIGILLEGAEFMYTPDLDDFSGLKTNLTGDYTIESDESEEYVVITGTKAVDKVTLQTPELSVTDNKDGTVSLTLVTLDEAVKCQIYRAASATGKYSLVEELDACTNEYVDTTAVPGITYFYKFRTALDDVEGDIYSEYSDVQSVQATLNTPVITVTSKSKTSINVSWEAIEGATGYQVYRATSKTGTYSLLKTTTSTSFTNTGLTTGKTYYYKVRAYKTVASTKGYSSFSEIKSAVPKVGKATYTVKNNGYDSIKITIDKVTGASGYEIYSSQFEEGPYQLVTRTTGTSYIHKKLITGNMRYYKIRAYATVNGSRKYGEYGEILSAIALPTAPKFTVNNTLSSNSLTIEIGKVSGATGYDVYKYNGEDFVRIAEVDASKLTYEDTDVVFGQEYTYKVAAVRAEKGGAFLGEFSEEITKMVRPATLTLSITNDTYTSQKVKLTANEDIGETYRFYLYRSTVKDSEDYELIGEGPEMEYTSSELDFNKTYYYKAVIERAGVKSEDSVIVSKKTALPAPTVTAKSASKTSIKVSYPAVEGATGYQIYRATTKTGTYKLVTTTTKTSYTNAGLTTGKTYYYKVRAYKTVSGKKVYGSYSTVASDKTRVATPTVTAVSNGYNSNKISWKKVTGATGYEVYLVASDGTSTRLTRTTGTSYTHKSLTTGQEYTYKVRAYVTVSGSRKYGDFSEVQKSTPIPSTPTFTVNNTLSSGYLQIEINKVSGATGYIILKKTGEDYVQITSTSELTYKDEDVIFGEEYSYKVFAYRELEDSVVNSNESDVNTAIVKPQILKVSVTNDKYNSQKITMVSEEGVGEDNYKIYLLRSTSKTGEYEQIYEGTELEYASESLKFNTTYYYKAVLEKDGVKSEDSVIVSKKTALPAPTVTAKSASKTSIKVSYPAVEGATGYQIYRATSKTGTYKLVTTTTKTSYTNTGLTTGKTYYYKVRAYKTVSGKKVYGSYSAVVSDKTRVATPTVTAVSNGYNSNKISWKKVTGASGYELYLVKEDGTSTMLTRTTGTSYTHKSLTTGQEYTYKVRAYVTVSGSRKYGDFSAVQKSTPIPSIPTFTVNNTLSSRYLQIEINKVSGATGYDIYIYNGTDYELLTSITDLTYQDINVTLGNEYSYKVVAYRDMSGNIVFGKESAVKAATVKPQILKVSVTNESYNKQKITMISEEGLYPEDNYKVYLYRSTSKTVKGTLIYEGTEFEHVETGLSFNKTYYYTAVLEKDGVESEDSVVVGKKTGLPAPIAQALSSSKTSIKVSYPAVEGATGYQIYRATTKTGTYKLVTTTTKTSYTNAGLTTGKTYYYKVRAYKTVSGNKVYGVYSEIVSAVPKVGAVNFTAKSSSHTSNKITWSKVTGASGYQVYFTTTPEDEESYKLLKTTTGTSYTHTGLTTGVTYYYKVRAYVTVSGSKKYGEFNDVHSATPVLATPELTAIKVTKNSITLAVSTVPGADAYHGYRVGEDYNDTLLSKNEEGLYVDSDLTTGETYEYYVVASVTIDGRQIFSETSENIKVIPVPLAPTISATRKSSGVYTINVVQSEFASGETSVQIYRSTNGGDYELIKTDTTNENPTFDDDVTIGNVYTYYAFVKVSETSSESSNTVEVTPTYDAKALEMFINPTDINYMEAYISLDDPNTIDGMELYRSKDGEKYSLLGTYTSNEYGSIATHWGETYYYKVRYFKMVNDVKVYSEFSEPVPYYPHLAELNEYPYTVNDDNYELVLNPFKFELVSKTSTNVKLKVTANVDKVMANDDMNILVTVEYSPSMGDGTTVLPTQTFKIPASVTSKNNITVSSTITIPKHYSHYRIKSIEIE